VLIDGIDVSDPSTVTRIFDLGQLLTGDIDRIEVLRGPQSGLYGADALGGVISITTKKGEGPPKITTRAEAGSFGRFNETASLSGSQDAFNYSFNISHFLAPSTPVTPPELLAPGRPRTDYYNNTTYSHRLGADLSENFAVNWVARYTDSKLLFNDLDFGTFPPTAVAAEQSSQAAHQFFTRGEAVWSAFDGRFKSYLGVNYTDHLTRRFSPDTGFGEFRSNDKGERVKFDWRGVATIMPGQVLVLGLEQERERLHIASDTDTRADNGNRAGYVELQSEFQKRLFFVANLRLDDNDAFGSHTTYRLAPAYIVPVTETKLKGSYGTGFKAPTLTQLFQNFPTFFFFGNPNLQPELSKGYDAGFEQPLFNDRVRIGATYFHNDVTNFISPIVIGFDPGSGFPITRYENVDQFTSDGVETFAAASVSDQLKLRADYTYTHVVASNEFGLLRKPRHKVGLSAIWNPIPTLTVASSVVYVSSWRDILRTDTTVHVDQPGYTVVNLAANYEVTPNLTAFARIDNLFNKHYQNPNGFEQTGFGIFGGVRFANR
jgi:vitamin B12 transporter